MQIDKKTMRLARRIALLVMDYEETSKLSVTGIDIDRHHTKELGMVPMISIISRTHTVFIPGLPEYRQ